MYAYFTSYSCKNPWPLGKPGRRPFTTHLIHDSPRRAAWLPRVFTPTRPRAPERKERLMAERLDVEFTAEGGIKLRAWLYLPEGPGPHPAITMAHGYAGTRAHGLAAY